MQACGVQDDPDQFLIDEWHLLPRSYVARIDGNQALAEALRHCCKSDQAIAEEINISAGYMSKFLRGVWAQWARRTIAFCRRTGSLAPLQWMAEQLGCDVVPRDPAEARIKALQEALDAERANNGRRVL